MYCFVMQPWTTIRGQSTVTTINQTENCWLDLSPYQDIVAWLDCKEVSAGTGGTNVQIAYQTAPTKDDSLFVSVVAAANIATGVATTIMLKDVVANPLGRWLRWQLTVTGSPSTAWDATFRVFIAANIVGRGGRAKAGATLRANAPLASGPASLASSVPSTPLHLQSSTLSYGTAVPVSNTATYMKQQPVTYGTAQPIPSKPSTFG
jgi:hypothetical protein